MHKSVIAFLRKVESKKLFIETDAWALFKYSALSEVVGWSLLIYGILADQYGFPGASFMLPIGGSIHGMLFLAYICILAATYSSLSWSRGRALVGFIVSALPYGTFFFEQWANKKRHQQMLQSYRRISVRGIIKKDHLLLALQPNNTVTWLLPGGYVEGAETAELALIRLLRDLTDQTVTVGALRHAHQVMRNKELTLELYFEVTNASKLHLLDVKNIAKTHGEIDRLQFINPYETQDLEPAFLRVK